MKWRKPRWTVVREIWMLHQSGGLSILLYAEVLQCFISGLSAELCRVSVAINHFRGSRQPDILSQCHHRRQVELIEKKLWKRRERGKKKKKKRHTASAEARLSTAEVRVNTGYQISTQNKSLSSSSPSHSASDASLWAACILCITRSNPQWTADSVKAPAPNPHSQNYHSL